MHVIQDDIFDITVAAAIHDTKNRGAAMGTQRTRRHDVIQKDTVAMSRNTTNEKRGYVKDDALKDNLTAQMSPLPLWCTNSLLTSTQWREGRF